MESKIVKEPYNNNVMNNVKEERKLKFCRHIQNGMLNSFINNYNDSNSVKNMFNLDNNLVSKNMSEEQAKNYLDAYLIKNLNLDWVILNNTQNLSLNSASREGCIFTLAFNETGSIMAASNHNHHIELWDMKERRLKKVIRDHKEIVTALEFFHGDSDLMMSCSLDKTIQLWKDFEHVHTFLDHSDWVRCISVSKDNKFFLSGCVSSVVKLWDLETQKVLKTISIPNPTPDLLNTVNSLSFMNSNDQVFLCGLRNGTVKIFDTRTNTVDNIVTQFKAHQNKLNSIKFNKGDKLLLSSGRDSLARLWDFRNLPSSDKAEINAQYALNEYKGHLCKGFNIDCNFFVQEKYVITGSEDSFIYLYDTVSGKLVTKIKTYQKCVNLVKPLPDCSPYSFVYTGLEDLTIHHWSSSKVLSKNVEKAYACKKNQSVEPEPSEYDELLKEGSNPETSLQMKLVEEIMAECGDIILRIFHANNLTYSNGMNFEHLMDAIQKNNDKDSLRLMQILNEKFLKKMMESFMSTTTEIRTSNTNTTKSTSTVDKKENFININCLLCDEKYFDSSSLISAMEVDTGNLDNIVPLLEFPNDYNSFANTKDQGEPMEDNGTSSTISTSIKTLYSNESISFKYNYLINKLI